jgi:hypothetical protein
VCNVGLGRTWTGLGALIITSYFYSELGFKGAIKRASRTCKDFQDSDTERRKQESVLESTLII